ncbi:PKD domain-containing protein [Polaribacter staleyi]|uniref:PKD domain-containing protein n=1 Tax=Polaribacter staleyi TaxID=2022337 RepID=UPI0031BBBA12
MKKLTLLLLSVLLTYSCTNTEENETLKPPTIAIDVVNTIFLPNNSVEIKATITDNGKQIQSILWKKTEGGSADFENDKKDIIITNLEAGDYRFTLTVTDSKNLSSDEAVTFSVSNAQILYNLNFENTNEEFKTSLLGNYPTGKKLLNLSEETNHCGTVFRGKKEDFTDWLTYSYTGNNSSFVATNMGTCLGYFTSAIEKEITFSEDFAANQLSTQFLYYMPGDFSNWGDYNLEVRIYENDYTYSSTPITTFSPTINKNGWTSFNKEVTVPIKKGSYKLVIIQTNAQTAIDNIILYKNN